MKIYPEKLKEGDEIRVIAPSRSLAMISKERRKIAKERFDAMGLKLSFGENVEKEGEFKSSSIRARIEDIHNAFSDTNVKAIITVVGGYNSNQLLKYIDWELIKKNPKIFCGYSDITAICNAIFAKTGLVTYYGPHYSSFGQKLYFDYTLECFKRCLFKNDLLEIEPSKNWSDDCWQKSQEDRELIQNKGFLMINEGSAVGVALGGNLCTLNLLQGTEFFPSLEKSILFIEDDDEVGIETFDRDLQSLIHLPEFKKVKGIVIGRFQKESKVKQNLLFKSIKSKKELEKLPVLADVDFGHTDPKITFPIGGEVKINVGKESSLIHFPKH